MESRSDRLVGAAATVLGIAIVAIAQGSSQTFHAGFGPGLFPTLIGAGIVLCGVVMVAGASIGARQQPPPPPAGDVISPPEDRMRTLIGVGAILASILFYYVAADFLGFLLTATIVMAGLMWLLWGRPLLSCGIAFLSAFLFMQVFAGALRVPLPWGPLLPYSRVLLWM